jgi:hypothetical protein
MNEDLEVFLEEFLNKSPCVGFIPLHDAVHMVEDVMSVTWYRNDPFQVQLFITPPNYVIPEHTHPNVDSFEVYLGGQIQFSLHGEFVYPEQDVEVPDGYGMSKNRAKVIRVLPNALHGGVFGPSGGVFMSVQKWLNGVKPTCVGADYTGVVMGEKHLKNVTSGIPVLKEQITQRDAAHKEYA